MIKKNEILTRFGVDSLSSIKDEDLIKMAEMGEFGQNTKWSAVKSWAFPNKKVLADHIRKAIETGKELRVLVTEGELYSEDQVIVEYV